jgi:hypothetical protein
MLATDSVLVSLSKMKFVIGLLDCNLYVGAVENECTVKPYIITVSLILPEEE